MSATTAINCGPDDPRIQQIKEAAQRNPKLTAWQCYKSFGVSRPTLDRWVSLGYIQPLYVPSRAEISKFFRKKI